MSYQDGMRRRGQKKTADMDSVRFSRVDSISIQDVHAPRMRSAYIKVIWLGWWGHFIRYGTAFRQGKYHGRDDIRGSIWKVEYG